MTGSKLSMNKIYIGIGSGALITMTAILVAAYLLTSNIVVLFIGLVFFICLFSWMVIFVILFQKKLTVFTCDICEILDDMMNGNLEPHKIKYEETLFARINYRLARLNEVMEENRYKIQKEKTELQEFISDISHQVRTPISNLKMINATLLGRELPKEKQREFLQAMDGQLDKLDFLMQAMVKTSRLESGVIALAQKKCSIYETLAVALGGILMSAEKKNIDIIVDCPEDLVALHDSKWTAEALFNILDNAVKYTANFGIIRVSVVLWEMYTKIDIVDNGRGIAEEHQASIFKRFYREEEVHETLGIGIGLYLAREIITLQGGYIKVTSQVGRGSTFSVFLLNK